MEKERYHREDDSSRERWDGGAYGDELEQSDRHRSKDKKKNSREEEKDHRSRDRERDRSKRSSDEVLKEREKDSKDFEKDRVSRGERRKDDRDEYAKDRSRDSKVREKDKDYDRDKHREKEHEYEREKDRKDRGKEMERERDRESEKERGRDKGRDRDREKEKEKDKAKEREKKDREKEKEGERDKDREKGKERSKQKNREADLEKERSRDRDNATKKYHEEDYEGNQDGELALDYEEIRNKDEIELNAGSNAGVVQAPSSELEERISRMKEERLKNKPDGVSEVLSWVNRSRKIEQKKALQLSKNFEEQDSLFQEENESEEAVHTATHDLAGVKVLHGLDKVMDGGAVVLTLKDQSILANGDINEDIDMLENVEIGEQKERDEAYKAAKKKTGVYDDKFNDEPGSEKKILPQYDDPAADEGVTLDERGRFTGEAEKKLEELRKRLQGVPTNNRVEDLNNSTKISSDYYTQEEMLKFKKPKKKKALRKKEKLDIDALEAEAISVGLGAGDLGSRNDGRRQAIKEEEARTEAEKRNSAYQSAYAKADAASKSLWLEQTLVVEPEEDESQVFAVEEEDLYKSLERARKLALKKQEQEKSGPQAIAALATTAASSQAAEDQNTTTGEAQESKVVITEMEEFVLGLHIDEEAHKPDSEDVFMDEDEMPGVSEQDGEKGENEVGGWTEVVDTSADEKPAKEDNDEIVPDETIHEVAVGKGLSGALKLLKDRGTLKESIEWGGRNMDKKKSKLVGIVDDDQRQNERFKDIRIERTDEFGRIVTPKEAFRMISHKFHGKGPGKMKLEKRMKQFQDELKLKQMKNSDTPSQSVERMREAQAQLKSPYIVLSGHVKPGQTSDPRSGFATVEKEFPGGLTPMLGDRKVEHFLGIKRKAEPGNSSTPKKPKT